MCLLSLMGSPNGFYSLPETQGGKNVVFLLREMGNYTQEITPRDTKELDRIEMEFSKNAKGFLPMVL